MPGYPTSLDANILDTDFELVPDPDHNMTSMANLVKESLVS